MSQVARKSYRRVVPRSATVRIYTADETGLKTKPTLPEQKSLISTRPTKSTTKSATSSVQNKVVADEKRGDAKLVTKVVPKSPGLAPLHNEELKGYMRPKSSRPGSSKHRDSVTSRPSTGSRPGSANPASKEGKKKPVIAIDKDKVRSRPQTVSTEVLASEIPTLENTTDLISEVENYKSIISQLEKKIQFLEESNTKLVKEKERLVRDLDNHLKANMGERTGLDQLKIQFSEQHAQNASLIVHNRFFRNNIRSLKTQICELEALIETIMTSCSPEHAKLAKTTLKQLA